MALDATDYPGPPSPRRDFRPTTRRMSGPGHFCFVAGTHISTLRGDIAVEDLKPGDQVKTKSGSYHFVTEVTVHTLDQCHPAAVSKIAPVAVRRGALGERLPRRDLMVTGEQKFEASQQMKIGHHVRMSPRIQGNALHKLRFVVFSCGTATAVRVEGLWTTATPCAAYFAAGAERAGCLLRSA